MKYNVYRVIGASKTLLQGFDVEADAIAFVNTSLDDISLKIIYE